MAFFYPKLRTLLYTIVEQSLSKIFSPLGITVSHLYGESTANVTDFEIIKQSDVIVATPEKAKALIRSGTKLENELKLIVIDEGHLLGGDERYIKNEIFLTHIKEFASQNQIKILLLSAVLPNANEVANWIAEDANLVAESEWKPALERFGLLLWDGKCVTLEWKSDGTPVNHNFIQSVPLRSRKKIFPSNKNEAIAATAVRLAKLGTVMIYSARANSIEKLAESVLLVLQEQESPDAFVWDQSLWKVFESVCKEELGSNNIVLNAARNGVICHNNRLPTLVRISMEKLMRSNQPRIIIASSTLGQGVNIGISTIIIATPYYSSQTISNSDFWNICGRAGRAFSDMEGKILYTIDATEAPWKVIKNKLLAQKYFDNRQMENVRSGLLIVLNKIYTIANNHNIDVDMFVEEFADNNFYVEYGHKKYLKEISSCFDLLDDELLAMHEDFCLDDDVTWINDVFEKSFAIIQAEISRKKEYIDLLKKRTRAILKKIPDKSCRQKIIASGIPLSVSRLMLDDIEDFKIRALSFTPQLPVDEQIDQIDNIVQFIENWSNSNAQCLIKKIPEQPCLVRIRRDWIKGVSLAEIMTKDPKANIITRNYYGFTLPWIIHGISQLFDDEEIVKIYSSIALFVELGLPNLISVKIYMAGVRSRTAALELASLDIFKEKNVSEIKQILTNFPRLSENLSSSAQIWIDFFKSSIQSPKHISFPSLTLDGDDIPDKLYVRERKQRYYLFSGDGYFCKEIKSSSDFPFSHIANIRGLYFERRERSWHLQSYDPRIIIE